MKVVTRKRKKRMNKNEEEIYVENMFNLESRNEKKGTKKRKRSRNLSIRVKQPEMKKRKVSEVSQNENENWNSSTHEEAVMNQKAVYDTSIENSGSIAPPPHTNNEDETMPVHSNIMLPIPQIKEVLERERRKERESNSSPHEMKYGGLGIRKKKRRHETGDDEEEETEDEDFGYESSGSVQSDNFLPGVIEDESINLDTLIVEDPELGDILRFDSRILVKKSAQLRKKNDSYQERKLKNSELDEELRQILEEETELQENETRKRRDSEKLLDETTALQKEWSQSRIFSEGSCSFDCFEEVSHLMKPSSLNHSKYSISYPVEISGFEKTDRFLRMARSKDDVFYVNPYKNNNNNRRRRRTRRTRSSTRNQNRMTEEEYQEKYDNNKKVYERCFGEFFNILCFHVNQEYVERSKRILLRAIELEAWKPSLELVYEVFKKYGFLLLQDEDEDDDDEEDNNNIHNIVVTRRSIRRRKKKKKYDDPSRTLYQTNFKCFLEILDRLMVHQFLPCEEDVHKIFYLMISVLSDRRLRHLDPKIHVKRVLLTLFNVHGSFFQNLQLSDLEKNLSVRLFRRRDDDDDDEDRLNYIIQVLSLHMIVHPQGVALKKRVLKQLLFGTLLEEEESQTRHLSVFEEYEFILDRMDRLKDFAVRRYRLKTPGFIKEFQKLYCILRLFSEVYLQMSPYNEFISNNNIIPPPPPNNNINKIEELLSDEQARVLDVRLCDLQTDLGRVENVFVRGLAGYVFFIRNIFMEYWKVLKGLEKIQM